MPMSASRLGLGQGGATGNLCLGTKVKVQERVGSFLVGLANRNCLRGSKTTAAAPSCNQGYGTLLLDSHSNSQHPGNAHPTLALVLGVISLYLFGA